MMDYLNDTFDTSLTYSESTEYGNSNAGKGLCMSLVTSGNNAGKAQLGADNQAPLGEFVELRRNKKATVTVFAQELILTNSGQNACTVGSKFICAGNGKIKDEPNSGAGSRNGRGLIKEVIGNDDGGKVRVMLF